MTRRSWICRIAMPALAFLFYVPGRAQLNMTKEEDFYWRLFKTGEKIWDAYEKVDDIQDKAFFLVDAAYKIQAREPLDEQEGTLVTGAIKVLYDDIEKFARAYELPPIEAIPTTLAPHNGSRESVSLFLTTYARNALYYGNKLKDYEQKQSEIDLFVLKLKELGIENRRIAGMYEDIISSGIASPVLQALVNDWYNLEVVYSKQIAGMIDVVKDKKRKWKATLGERTREFGNYRANLLVLLDLERLALRKAHDEATAERDRLNKEVAKLEKELAELRRAEIRIAELTEQMKRCDEQITVLEGAIAQVNGQIKQAQDRIAYIQSDAYLRNFNTCPNRKAYWDCEHDALKTTFINNKNQALADARALVQRLSGIVGEYRQRQAVLRTQLASAESERSGLLTRVLDIPQVIERLKEASERREEFLAKLSVQLTFALMTTNEKNTADVRSIPEPDTR